MLQKPFEITEQLYNPINHMTQNELMEKFNLAFYEGQNLSKADIISTFEEVNDETPTEEDGDVNETNNDELNETNDDYLIDYLLSNSPVSTPCSDVDISFDFNEFVNDFNENFGKTENQMSSDESFDTETFTTESSVDADNKDNICFPFFTPPPINSNISNKAFLDNLELEDIDINPDLIDFEDLQSDFQDIDDSVSECHQDQESYQSCLPPVECINKNSAEFNSFIRNAPGDNISFFNQSSVNNSDFGHLIGTNSVNNNFIPRSISPAEETNSYHYLENTEDNHIVLRQNEALLNDDPLLSSTNIICLPNSKTFQENNVGYNYSNDCDEITSSTNLQCKWERCYQMYECQSSLVKHIEKSHVELKRGEEFTCYWENCPRKTKPFNARYKLLIHMRVHSGEKPNKCPFKGCNKAFSRLENLKIHQRSHTGERPYLCQFSNCKKSFSNSSDRAKHQRTHFDTKPYACQVMGCSKKYTDPSSLRKHVKNHTAEEQMQIKKRAFDETSSSISPTLVKKYFDTSKQKAIKSQPYDACYEHSYSSTFVMEKKYYSLNVKQDLKNKLSEKNKLKTLCC